MALSDKEKQQRHRDQIRTYKKNRKKIEVLYTKDEYDFIKKQAEIYQCSITSWIKNSSLKTTKHLIKTPKTDLMTVAQMRKMGVNFNQLLKVIHSKKDDSIPDDLTIKIDKILSYLKDLVDKIR